MTHRLSPPISMVSLSIACVMLLFSVFIAEARAQDLNPVERRALQNIQRSIKRAGQSYTTKKYSASASLVSRAMRDLERLVAKPRPELLEAVKEDYGRLKKAHELLTKEGEKLPELFELPAAMTEGDAISFKDTVAPILIAKCGNCHVRQNRGDFSAASFQALMNSTTIDTIKPNDSRLIEVIESGEMPKGGLKVEDGELATLKAWIAQGAKFDGDDQTQNLAALTGAQPAPTRRRNMTANKPTGKETVSFGLDVAPVIMENCGQCHLIRNPRGNFSMANFRDLLRGGDGGNPIVPGKSAESGLIKRLRGDGVEVMPPFGKLDDAIISKIATWVDEGAAFDGGDVQLPIATVAAKVKADSMSHEDLLKDRIQLAAKTWKLVMNDVDPEAVPSDNFLVTGASSDTRVTEISETCESIAKKIAATWRVPKNEPLVKGNISVFVFSKRYDFGEFGRMVEKRDFPREIKSHWDFNTIDAYSALLATRNETAEDLEVELTQQIAALHLASRAIDAPRWFIDGVALWTTKKIHARSDELLDLDSRAEQAAGAMNRVDDFLQNRMPGDQSALVGYLFIKQLRAASGAKFNALIKQLSEGAPFEVTFQQAYGGTPAELIRRLTGRSGR